MKTIVIVFSFLLTLSAFASDTGTYICNGQNDTSAKDISFEVKITNQNTIINVLQENAQTIQASGESQSNCLADSFDMVSTPMSDIADYVVTFRSNCDVAYDVSAYCVYSGL